MAVVQASIAAGADAIASIGGLPTRLPQADGSLVYGRLGGPAIVPIAFRVGTAVAAAVAVPVIGIGSVAPTDHAHAMLDTGARAVAPSGGLLADLPCAKVIAEGGGPPTC